MSVPIKLVTKNSALRNIGWTLSPNCKNDDNGKANYDSNGIYQERCDLAIGQTYTLRCKSYQGDGWHSSYVLIENVAYCEDFTNGEEKIYNITITGIYRGLRNININCFVFVLMLIFYQYPLLSMCRRISTATVST